MMVMLANNSSTTVGYLAGRYPGRIGHLYSPGGQRGPKTFIPYALDNGAFGHNDDWDVDKWTHLLKWAQNSGQSPLWALVPDVVGDRERTLERWNTYAPLVCAFNWPLGFAVQDGMLPDDVPHNADIIFVGGSTAWKWSTVEMWCAEFPRVHVGRVNGYKGLRICHDAGAESTDGTGFMRGDPVQLQGLFTYLHETSGADIS